MSNGVIDYLNDFKQDADLEKVRRYRNYSRSGVVVFNLDDVVFVATALVATRSFEQDVAWTLGSLKREEAGGFDPAQTVVRGANHSYC